MSDERTLRLASVQLSSASVHAFIMYQQTLLQALDPACGASEPSTARRLAKAHARALEEAGLDALTQQRLSAAISEYVGRSVARRAIGQRVSEAEAAVQAARASGQVPPEREAGLLERARRVGTRLDEQTRFVARYGPEALAALAAREDELLTLHLELRRRSGDGLASAR
ncbi:MAG: hypothetical protein INH41_09735 [Myxococcaceae bacterium]|jgi:hypothetical protein|nr:hypothetical protein [Myxococcaceae bacterium]MCA3012665.1 hypothetical protein [Myxococcaceae bacterium]